MTEAQAWNEVARRLIEWRHIERDGLCYTARMVVGAEDVILWKMMLTRAHMHMPMANGGTFTQLHAYMPRRHKVPHPNLVNSDREAAESRAMAALWFSLDAAEEGL